MTTTTRTQAPRAPHTSATVSEVRRLVEAGWSVYGIRQLMRRRGLSIDDQTIRRWVDPEYAARQRADQKMKERRRDARRSRGRLGAGPTRSPEFRLERIKQLRAAGVSKSNIARVMTFDFPNEPINEAMVRQALETSEPPTVYRDAFTRDAVNASRRERLLARSEPVPA